MILLTVWSFWYNSDVDCTKCGAPRVPGKRCSPCNVAQALAWNKANPQRHEAARARYHASPGWLASEPARKQRLRLCGLRYRQEHPEEHRESIKAWQRANKAKVRA